MCWSAEVSVAMVGVGVTATAVTYLRAERPAIWLTLAYFTVMEALQVWGYAVVDQCGTPSNQTVTVLSDLHIVLQPFLINAFAMEMVPHSVMRRARVWVYAACALSAGVMLLQIAPLTGVGPCLPGSPLCGEQWCTVSGTWHIGWQVPYNGLMTNVENQLGLASGFPTYMITAFALPLVYGAWRFVLLHAVTGPVLAWMLTDNPNEMPAVWCLFSIAILLIALSPLVRRSVETETWWGRSVQSAT
ncbi:DUF5765 domain-containing protein [uncultured Tateyamaria sp.]|uniref:DUF5765 domain-containing protein n=1 Tax=uncultured Tateyamaria sp. TaxID=455651 RepID=UPI0026361B6D|nr:DUF5765 domain-containing protein [uncultured Tateyamaria sp.]